MSFPPLKKDEINSLIDFAVRLADTARPETLSLFRTKLDVANKLDQASDVKFDPVTMADRNAERVIRALIEKTFPDHGIHGEEFSDKITDSPFRWVLDPIDGTRSFIAGVPTWTTLIALEYAGKPIIGIIDQPWNDERWLGTPDGTTFERRGKKSVCRLTGHMVLEDAIITTTDPSPEAYFSKAEAETFATLKSAARLTRYSCDAYGYGVLASGGFNAVIESGLNHYDAAALIPVVKGAGGVITDWDGEEVGLDWAKPRADGGKGGQLLAVSGENIHREILRHLSA